MDKETRNLLIIGVIGVGAAYGVYWLFSKFKDELKKGADKVAAPIADAYIALTQNAPIKLLGKIQFSNGFVIDLNQITNGIYPDGEKSKFSYLGKVYTLGPRNEKGYYTAS